MRLWAQILFVITVSFTPLERQHPNFDKIGKLFKGFQSLRIFHKMKNSRVFLFTLVLGLVLGQTWAQRKRSGQQSVSTPPPQPEKPPTINWGKCPQLEPKEAEKTTKAGILEACLKSNPIPKNLTETAIENHQKAIAKCALSKENWFNKNGSYKFSKAESEIKRKGLAKDLEKKLLSEHKKCEQESKQKFSEKAKIVEQIQLYQACMDFHITQNCEIKIE